MIVFDDLGLEEIFWIEKAAINVQKAPIDVQKAVVHFTHSKTILLQGVVKLHVKYLVFIRLQLIINLPTVSSFNWIFLQPVLHH